MKLPSIIAILATSAAFAGEPTKKVVPPLEEDPWKFTLAMPGFMFGIDGNVGIGPAISNVDVGFDTLRPKIDMIWASRGEISKGRFGVMGELLYSSLSDGIGSNGVIKKVDVRVDEYLADITLRYRLIEGPRGFLDVLAGVRYTNMYNAVSLRPNDEAIAEVAQNFTDEVSARVRDRVEQVLSEGKFRDALRAAVSDRITAKIATITGPEPVEHTLPVAALAYRTPRHVGLLIDRLVRRNEAELVAAASADLRAAEAADKAAIQQAVAAEKAKLTAKAAALRARVDQRIATAQKELTKKVTKVLQKNLNQNASLTEAWWDPYVGLRARYNFTDKFYVIGRGDIGGFGVGSDLMWQAEGALGYQLTERVFTEVGYRALSFDYESGGFTNDTITHGVQVTMGITF